MKEEMKRIGIVLVLILVAGCGRRVQRTGEVATPLVDLSGTYVLDGTASTDFKTDAHKYIFLNGVDERHPITITQTDSLVSVVFTTRWSGVQTNMLKSIGKASSPWSWTTNGLTCIARPSWLFNFYMIPGATHLDQRCTILRVEGDSLEIERSTAEGGRMFWLIPWKDAEWTSKLVLKKRDGAVTTTKSALSSEAAPSAAPDER